MLFQATIPGGGICDVAQPRDCWKESTHGYSYKDKDRLRGGVGQIQLKEGLTGGAKIQIKAGGVALDHSQRRGRAVTSNSPPSARTSRAAS